MKNSAYFFGGFRLHKLWCFSFAMQAGAEKTPSEKRQHPDEPKVLHTLPSRMLLSK